MKPFKSLGRKVLPVAAASLLLLAQGTPASAATLTSVSVQPSSGAKAATAVTYTITASGVTTASTQCIRVEFDTLSDGTGTKPVGLDLTAATFGGNYVPTPGSFTVNRDNTNGVLTITGAAQTPASASNRTIVLGSITNPTNAGSYYAVVTTFNNTNCSSSPIDNASAAFSTTDAQAITVTVDASFSFVVNGQAASTSCNGVNSSVLTTGTAINFGRVNAGSNAIGVQQLEVDSNAPGGYAVYAKTTGVLSAGGGNNIPDIAGAGPMAFGTNAGFGYTTGDAGITTPMTSGLYGGNLATVSAPGAEVARGPANTTFTDDQTCVGFRVNVGGDTKAGAYSTTLIYTAVPTF